MTKTIRSNSSTASSYLSSLSPLESESNAEHDCKIRNTEEDSPDSPSCSTSGTNSTVDTSSSDTSSSSDSEMAETAIKLDFEDEIFSFSFRPFKYKNKKWSRNTSATGPMKLSRRLSYKLNRPHLSPMKSPIVAKKLNFLRIRDNA